MERHTTSDQAGKEQAHKFLLELGTSATLSTHTLLQHCASESLSRESPLQELHPIFIEVNKASFTARQPASDYPVVALALQHNKLMLSCTCSAPDKQLCAYQQEVLFMIANRHELRLFFDEKLRHEEIRKVAGSWGLEGIAQLDDYFQLEYTKRAVNIVPRLKELFPVGKLHSSLTDQLLSSPDLLLPPAQNETSCRIVVLSQHRFYHHLYLELFQAQRTKEGKIKSPLAALAPLDLVWKSQQQEEIKFYGAISKFQHQYSSSSLSAADVEALKALVRNPLGLNFYYHDVRIAANVTAGALVPITLKNSKPELVLYVQQKDDFYEVSGKLMIEDAALDLSVIKVKYQYFVQLGDKFYLLDKLIFLRIIEFFKQYNYTLLVHHSKWEEFRESILLKLEHRIRIQYTYYKPASPRQLTQLRIRQSVEQLLYLEDSEHWILISPVMRYGEMEIPVLSKKQLYALDIKGNPISLERDEAAELEFIARLLQQHPDFEEQLNQEASYVQHDCFYLPKTVFLDENWFLDAFEAWQNEGITILGFNQLSKNKLNLHKAQVSISLNSGVDWFDTHLDVRYGNQRVSLRHLQKSLRNRSRFVQLGDGSQGILPKTWIEKFRKFFEAGQVVGESLQTPKILLPSLRDMYDEEVLSASVKEELARYQAKVAAFDRIEEVQLPKALKASLRGYQKAGLNWLNFLDTFGFGGCLADDMGLGKTLQVLAFILSQREKEHQNTNLVVVPTTLIFNWQAEVEKFAPDLKILTLYGPNRLKSCEDFEQYELILTAYGTLLQDVRFLKKFRFNYIILDESQAIKNPESQRYKAARLLQSRNRLVLTGTPFENNTFDIYGQLSFACPGLLGSKQDFKEQYSSLIDKFKDSKRARALQQKISPFILRRTKEQVAPELPEKTEMLMYCEMGSEQRRVYNAYAREFREFLLTKTAEDLDKNRLHVLQGLTKLRQICNAPALLNDSQFYSGASAKMDVLMEQIAQKAPYHKILVFSQFVGMLELVKKELLSRNISHEYLTGKSRRRAAKVSGFQENENIRVFLISLKAGGTGLNLTAADYVYLLDPWWNPAVENQAIDRVHRIGQQKNVVAVRLVCPDTIEEKIMRLQESKTALADELIKTDTAALKSISRQQLLGLLD